METNENSTNDITEDEIVAVLDEDPEAEVVIVAEYPDTDIDTEADESADSAAEADVVLETVITAEESEEPEADDAVEADEVPEKEDTAEASATEPAPEKKKTGWTKVTTIVVVIAAVLVLGILGFYGNHEGWFDALKPKAKNSCEIGDYSKIEVLDSAVNVTDETVDGYISSLVSDYPDAEFDDAWSKEYGSTVLMRDDIQTADDMREYAKSYIYNYYLHSAMLEYLRSITTVKSYDEEKMTELMAYSEQGLENYAAYYGMSIDNIASAYGYATAEEYETAEAQNYLASIMMIDKLMKDLNLTYSQEDVDADMQLYMNINGLSEQYTLEEFKQQSGETWCYLYENLQYKSDLVAAALEDNVVFLEDAPE